MEEEKDQLMKRVERLKKRVSERSKAVAFGCHHPWLASWTGECKQGLRLTCCTPWEGIKWLREERESSPQAAVQDF